MYYTGSANSWADLSTAIFNACVASGWTLTADVLSKSTSFVRITVSTVTSGNPGPGLIIQGGTGYSSGALVNPSPVTPRLGRPSYLTPEPTFPIQYFIHIFANPDEVFVVVRSDVDKFHFLAFGVSNVPGIGGTGLWLSASCPANMTSSDGIYISYNPAGPSATPSGAFMWQTSGGGVVGGLQDTINVDIDGFTWANTAATGITVAGRINALVAAIPLIQYSPNAWNSASPLIRIRGLMFRSSNKSSLICDIVNARYVRVNNFDPREIITIGADRWSIYPFYRKNAAVPDAGGNSPTPHSGTFGWAIRYDGP